MLDLDDYYECESPVCDCHLGEVFDGIHAQDYGDESDGWVDQIERENDCE